MLLSVDPCSFWLQTNKNYNNTNNNNTKENTKQINKQKTTIPKQNNKMCWNSAHLNPVKFQNPMFWTEVTKHWTKSQTLKKNYKSNLSKDTEKQSCWFYCQLTLLYTDFNRHDHLGTHQHHRYIRHTDTKHPKVSDWDEDAFNWHLFDVWSHVTICLSVAQCPSNMQIIPQGQMEANFYFTTFNHIFWELMVLVWELEMSANQMKAQV